MKSILVPIDFSETAQNAAVYAVEFAHSISAKVVFFHAYHPPLPVAGGEYSIMPDTDIELESAERLENFKRDIQKITSTNTIIECDVKIGFAVTEILEETKEKSPDLLIMGITGGGIMSEYLLGSNVIEVMRKCEIPSIIVPVDAKFRKPVSIVLACDFTTQVSAKAMTTLKNIAHLFRSKLHILNLEKPQEVVTFEKAMNGIQLENSLSMVDHTLHFLPTKGDMVKEINDFIEKNNAEMLAMIPHKHGVLYRFLNQSQTKQMAFHAHVPILILQE
jgi:nucleotide-binding universal stress UspA family protein